MNTTPAIAPLENSAPDRSASFKTELFVFAVILLVVNAPLVAGVPGVWNRPLAFFPIAVAQGEWWRVATHPFVHVSWYHLLLDGTAFFLLYAELRHWSSHRRLVAVAASALGSLVAALGSPITWSNGFGGLSGAAHGLMAVAALDMIRRAESRERLAGWMALAAVLGKALVEALTGEVALSFLHFGLMGSPVAVCHAGGVLGGMIAFCCLRSKRQR